MGGERIKEKTMTSQRNPKKGERVGRAQRSVLDHVPTVRLLLSRGRLNTCGLTQKDPMC